MIIDGLQCGYFDRDVFERLKKGNVGCVTPTLGFWEGAVPSLESIDAWRQLVRANEDLVGIATTAAQIEALVAQGKVAILLGFQNANLLEGHIGFVELFADLGVRVIQLTYNNQNELGGSCYEEHDSGLARFGKEVIREMNRCGVVIDLSHVGNRTSREAIEHSTQPVAITHANPDSVYPHKRNKTDDVLHALRANGGVIGCAAYRNISGDEFCSTVDKWCELVARTVDIAGIDHVGIGTDKSHGTTQRDLDWMRKGNWTRGTDFGAGSAARPGKAAPPDWFKAVEDLGNVEPALARVGFNAEEVRQLTHGNWLRLYRTVMGQ
ncbi:membrane dipeptidase [Alcaligenaceae bacterium A4P071]|nr:membrane dipeptidase [Alcaligenaceae bacterium B3P038]MDQ2147469.1 membrane dipeptidase [Alcaligenaceae bacterium C4P045]MDQ2184800.1 membrane dipeptidase [Alcaligenaceae bacterium A4P071]